MVDSTNGVTTNINGRYSLNLPAGEYEVTFSYVGYESVTERVSLEAGETIELNQDLRPVSTVLDVATVSSGRYKKALSEVTVSMEVLQPGLVENTSKQTLDQAIEKIPGVQVIDRQANIRGGSGFSAGAGSRVLLLMDDIPILQPDAGFPNWDDLPMENIGQIEVIKGAASTLYGSSAMNGVINFRTAYATSDPVTKASVFSTFFFSPRDRDNKWWDTAPFSLTTTFSHRRKIKKFDLVVGGFYLTEQNFERNADRHIGRLSFSTRYRLNDRISITLNGNFNGGERSSWFYWVSEDSKYEGEPETFVTNNQRRFNIDPSITVFDRVGNRHRILTRYYDVDNNITNNQANRSRTWYTEYQFQRRFNDLDLVLSAGAVYIGSSMEGQLYGDTISSVVSGFSSRNLAGYAQLEKEFFDRLNLSAGLRYEQNRLVNPEYIGNSGFVGDSTITEGKPVFRLGANYRLFEQSFVRASWGQGYRYPTIAERHISTNQGGFLVQGNPQLQSETGWSAELGLRQGFQVSSLEGFLDIAAFVMQYQDMIEFNVLSAGLVYQPINIGDTDIRGVEVTLQGRGKVLGTPISFLAGYMYINPRMEQFSSEREAPSIARVNFGNSTSQENLLKYRNQHNLKADLEATLDRLSIGLEFFHASQITAIDYWLQVPIDGLDLTDTTPGNPKESRAWGDSNNGYTLINPRVAFRFSDFLKASLILNNALNQEYSVRPGRIMAPRNLIARLDFDL